MAYTWLITGTSSGLGRLLTEKLLERGDRVIATLRRPGGLDDLQVRYNGLLHVEYFDITDTQTMRDAITRIFNSFSRIDRVVSNAGYGLFGAAEEASDVQIERLIATNLTGSVQFIRAVLPHLRKQGGGRIVQVSSEGGQITYPCFSIYHASKWGIEGFVESVAQEVSAWGIDFVLVEPGPTATAFVDGLEHTLIMDDYESSSVGDMRRALSSGSFPIKGDALKTVEHLINTVNMVKPPFRLALGSTAYHSIEQALTRRLSELEDQKHVTLSADRDSI
jgi:NAD(P)-dependent dehydrogenase (short-subunit alcohol dehydrogenase family)